MMKNGKNEEDTMEAEKRVAGHFHNQTMIIKIN
jgi:hypothetical protein